MILITVLRLGYARSANDGSYRADGTVTLVRQYPPSAFSSSPSSTLPTPLLTLLVDTGSPYDGPALLDTLASLGVSPRDVDVVVCTHGHVDHVGNLNLFSQSEKTVFYLGCDKLIPKDAYESIEFQDGMCVPRPSPLKDPKLYEKDDLNIEGKSKLILPTHERMAERDPYDHLVLLKTPGHTESDLSVVVVGEDVRWNCLDCASGRSFKSNMISACSTCGAFPAANSLDDGLESPVVVVAGDLFEDENDEEDDGVAWKGNSWNTEIQSLNRVLVRRIADVIVPGHGRPFKAGRK